MIEQLAIFSENKPGRLERITDALAKAGVNLRAIHVASLGEMGVVKIVVDRPDRPGALHQVTAVLSRAAINIENASGFAVSGGDAVLILEVADLPAAERALAEADFNTLDEGEFEAAVA